MGFKTCSQNIKIFFKFLYFYIWLIAKTWLNFLVDDLEKDYKIEKIKRLKKSLMSLLLSPFITHSFFLNENF